MRAALAALAVSAAVLTVGACQATEDVRAGVEGARSSAAALGSGATEACRAAAPHLATLNDLATRLAAEPALRNELAPQVRRSVTELTTAVGDQAGLRPAVAAARELSAAVGKANPAAVEATARQAEAAFFAARNLCLLTG